MQAINNFAHDLVTDFQTISNEKNPTQDMQAARFASVFARVFGAIFTVNAAVVTVKIVAGVAVGPTAIIAAIVSGVLAYDFIRVGYNLRKVNNALYPPNNPNQSFLSKGINFLSSGAHLFGAIGKEAYRNTPYVIHDTILCEPLYRLFHGV